MRLDMRSEPHAQFLRRVKHELTVAAHNGGIDHDSWCLDILELAAQELVLKGRLGGLWD